MKQAAEKESPENAKAVAHKLGAYRRLVERLPVTMRPSLNQQLDAWETQFPFEQARLTLFLSGLESFQPSALDALTAPLRTLETKMGVEHWNFSTNADTMENASMLARSQYYAEWRAEVQRVFEAVNAGAGKSAPAPGAPARLVLVVLPESLPFDPHTIWKRWDRRGQEIKISGDARRITELLIQGQPGAPGIAALLAQQGAIDSSDLWLIDADAKLDSLLTAASRASACSLNYAELKPFRDKFLAEVNTVPKSIEITDQTLAAMRHQNWDRWWPAPLAGQTRLRSFVIDLFLSGNGALIFSNAFVEWAASEALRRARPRVLIARFGLRAKPKPFTSIAIFENQQRISALPDVEDPEGSATDALILARYIGLAVSRYPEQDQTFCLCVSESLNSAYLIPAAGQNPDWGPEHPVSPEELHTWIVSRFKA